MGLYTVEAILERKELEKMDALTVWISKRLGLTHELLIHSTKRKQHSKSLRAAQILSHTWHRSQILTNPKKHRLWKTKWKLYCQNLLSKPNSVEAQQNKTKWNRKSIVLGILKSLPNIIFRICPTWKVTDNWPVPKPKYKMLNLRKPR